MDSVHHAAIHLLKLSKPYNFRKCKLKFSLFISSNHSLVNLILNKKIPASRNW